MKGRSLRLRTMENLIAAYNDHDVDRIVACMTEDCVLQTFSGPEPSGSMIVGADAIAERSRAWFERFPDSRWIDERHTLATDGRGMTTWTFVGSDSETGAAVRRRGCDLFEFRGEKVAMKDTYQKQSPDRQPAHQLLPIVARETLGEPVGRYVHGMKADGILFVSGMAPLDRDGRLVSEDAGEQTRATLENMGTVLEAAGFEFRNVVKETIYLTDVRDRFATHSIRESFYGDHVPASTLIGVKELVVPGMKVEIDAVAMMT